MCSGVSVLPLRLEQPFATSIKRFGQDVPGPAPFYSLSFVIDRSGRAVDIQSRPTAYSGFFIDTNDLAPSLATSTFPSDAPQQKCTITYVADLMPVPEAPPSLLYEVASAPTPGAGESEVYARLSSGGDCARGPGSPRRLNYPPFEIIAQPPGTRSWSFLSFDVDADGRTRGIHVLGSSGNAGLDAASTKALRDNRYSPRKVSHGCTFHFYRLGSTPITAPAIPPDAPHDNSELPACAIDPKSIPTLLSGNAYPAQFSARRIEGYAIIGFDTASWGGVGNVRVLASEPDASFGQAAIQAIYNASVMQSDAGHRGCVSRVMFRLPKEAATK
jgi:TonB family protein